MNISYKEILKKDSLEFRLSSDTLSSIQLTYVWEKVKNFVINELDMEFNKSDMSLFTDEKVTFYFSFKDKNLEIYEEKKDEILYFMNSIKILSDDLILKAKRVNTKEISFIRKTVLHLMIAKKRDEASELIVKELKRRNKFYAVRDDDKKELWIYCEGIYVPNGATYVQEFCREILEDTYTTTFSNLIIDKIRADSFIDPDFFFKQNVKEEVAVLNGILNIYTKTLLPFSDEKIFFQKIPVTFDSTKTCPNIKKFISDITEDEKDALVVQELFGDLLHKEYKFERCFMWLGEGRNGKSKLAELMKRFIGVRNCCSIHPSTLEDPDSFSISSFFGKLANISLDINSTALKNISLIKSLSGRDLISAPRKFKTPIEFENYAKLIFGANQLPMTFDTKDSFWERWILLLFPYTFISEDRMNTVPESVRHKFKIRDNDIIEKITTEDEMSGLLNFALEGFERLNKNGCFSYKYTPDQVKNLWIMKSDSFSSFFNTYLEHEYSSKIRKNDLRKYYADYCNKNKVKAVSEKLIKRKMQEEGIVDDETRFEGQYESFWSGVRIKEQYEEKDEFSYSKLKQFESQVMLSFTKKLTEEEVQ